MPMFGSGLSGPRGFGRMCIEAEVGMGLMVGVCALGVLGVGVGVWGWRGDGGIERARGEGYGEEKRAGTGAYPMA